MNGKILFKMFLLMMGASATAYLTWAMILASLGAKQICFYEHNLFVSIFESIIGFFATVYLCYLCYMKGMKLKGERKC